MTLDQPLALSADQIRAPLRILATTDLHMHLLAHDYFTDRPTLDAGLARTATLIRKLRAAAPTSLLLDNGDFLQGNPLSDWVAENLRPGTTDSHPMVAAMNALGYDAGTLGNHEFNYGLDYLDRALAQAGFPIVSANITTAHADTLAADHHYVPPFVILDRVLTATDGSKWPIRIGVIGFAPPQITVWDGLRLAGRIGTRDIVDAARAHVPTLRAMGADIVIALCHSGIGAEQHTPGMENAAVPLATVPGIDAILTGHTHQVFPGPGIAVSAAVDPRGGTLHGKPAVMAGFNGSHLGVIDLLLDRADGRWRTAFHTVRVEAIARRGKDNQLHALACADPELTAIAQNTHLQLLDEIRRPVGQTTVPLHSYFSLVMPDASLQVVADAQRGKARAVLAGGPYERLPILSAVAPFKVGGRGRPEHYLDIPAGPLLRRHASELYPYPNAFCIIALPGAAICDWLERSAALLAPIKPGVLDQPLIDPAFPSYNFDMLDGLRYVIDPSQPARTDPGGKIINPTACRVSNITFDGQAIDPDATFLLATNGYRAGGGGGFMAASMGTIVYQGPGTTRDVLLDHMRQSNPLSPQARPTWRFRPLPGTAAWFDTGPGAIRHETALTETGISPLSDREGGFRRYQIRF